MIRQRSNRSVRRQQYRVDLALSTIRYSERPERQRRRFSTWRYVCVLIFYINFSLFIAITLQFYVHNRPIQSIRYRLPKPPKLTGALKPNQELTDADVLLPNEINGPESIVIHEKSKTIYVGLRNGFISAIEFDDFGDAKLVKSFKLFNNKKYNGTCDGSYYSFLECGRPLGMRFSRKNPDLLFVADAYFGLFLANLQNDKILRVIKSRSHIPKGSSRPIVHFNDFDISPNERHIVFTEPSYRFSDRDYHYAMIEHRPDGRLLHYNMYTGLIRVLIDRLYYPSGVEFDKTGKCVFFSEMGNLRILKYCFSYKTTNYTVVASNLPGYPGKIRKASNGMLWVPLGQVRLKDDSWITENPFLRDMIAMIVRNPVFMAIFDKLLPKYGLLLLIDPVNGTIMRSFHDPTGLTIGSISQATELDNGAVLLGGDSNMFLARFKPSKLS